ncbi:MAG: hypothetical protein GX774_09195, partial [Armatimonadetes bacterium]|nr:hypothetical protein [Armatimonadota bacterium]
MKRILIAAALTLTALTTAMAAEDQAYLGLFVETKVMKMAGMPAMPELPAGVDLSQVPGLANLMGMGAPQRALTVRLWSPGLAPKEATAHLLVPAGLKQGERLDLELY